MLAAKRLLPNVCRTVLPTVKQALEALSALMDNGASDTRAKVKIPRKATVKVAGIHFLRPPRMRHSRANLFLKGWLRLSASGPTSDNRKKTPSFRLQDTLLLHKPARGNATHIGQ